MAVVPVPHGERSRRGVDRDHRVAIFSVEGPGFNQGGHGPDGGVATQVGVAPGIHVKQPETSLLTDRFGHDSRHDATIPSGFAGQQFAHMVVTGFEVIPFGFNRAAGQAANTTDQQPGGFPLGVGIDGDDEIRVAVEESVFGPIQFQHKDTPILAVVPGAA